jgi:hypothetical protein
MSMAEAEPIEDTINAHTNAAYEYAATFQNLMQQQSATYSSSHISNLSSCNRPSSNPSSNPLCNLPYTANQQLLIKDLNLLLIASSEYDPWGWGRF